jgi:hypothetical protein
MICLAIRVHRKQPEVYSMSVEHRAEGHLVFRTSGAASWQHPDAAASERRLHCLRSSVEGRKKGRAAVGMPRWQPWRHTHTQPRGWGHRPELLPGKRTCGNAAIAALPAYNASSPSLTRDAADSLIPLRVSRMSITCSLQDIQPSTRPLASHLYTTLVRR